MRCLWGVVALVAALSAPPVAAQSIAPAPDTASPRPTTSVARVPMDAAWLSSATAHGLTAPTTPRRHSRPALFAPLGRDFNAFFSPETARTVSVFVLGAIAASPFDRQVSDQARVSWSKPLFNPGRIAGSFAVQVGGAAGTYLIGRAIGNDTVTGLGADLVRAQILSQSVVQAGKLATHRIRPDASNHHSLPSGHAASAFATAGVLQRHFGWKVGVPAYVLASYVGASRVAANKHYPSDVLMGAGIGLIAAHVVTVPIAGRDFAVSVAPTRGGAAITFSPK